MSDTCEVFCYDEKKVNEITPLIDNAHLTSAAVMFKALSDTTRLKIAYALLQADELCVCDVSHIIGATVATVSHHLRHLRSIGLAKSRKEGRLVFYSLDDDHVKTLVEMAVVHSEEVEQRDGTTK